MNIFHVIVPLFLFFSGLYLLHQLPIFKEDPLQLINSKTANVLSELVKTKYFSIIRLNINEECELGVMKRICKSKSCTVCRCNDKDIPQFWTNTEKVISHTQDQDLWAIERQNGGLGWVWHVEDEANDRGQYFDIHTNIESFTNYNGSYIWKLIYEENCFKGSNLFSQMCMEEKILYNIISGLHTSISTHLSRFYKHTVQQSTWADLSTSIEDHKFNFNHTQYQTRVLQHPQRIRNLLFLYRVLAKAIVTASPYLKLNLTIQSDDVTQDLKAKGYLMELLKELQGFDLSPEQKQTLKFFTPGNPKVREYQKYIHNISEILNCVECEKCRVFGKMQTYGVGTALKILLGYPTPYKRNEVVALFNVFNKISMSVDTYYSQRKEVIKLGYERTKKRVSDSYKVLGGLLCLFYVWYKYREEFILPEYVENKVKQE